MQRSTGSLREIQLRPLRVERPQMLRLGCHMSISEPSEGCGYQITWDSVLPRGLWIRRRTPRGSTGATILLCWVHTLDAAQRPA